MSDPIFDAIDWSANDKLAESTNECRCGAVFRSHAKMVVTEVTLRLYTRKPCPACGLHDKTVSSKSDPEFMPFGG